MIALKNVRKIDYLWTNGIQPLYERYGVAYYKTSDKIRNLLNKYYIEHFCIPNRLDGR